MLDFSAGRMRRVPGVAHGAQRAARFTSARVEVKNEHRRVRRRLIQFLGRAASWKIDLTLDLTPECILIVEATSLASGPLQIGTLSKQSGLSVDAIRFYERERLLQSPRRSRGGFRLFGEEDLAVLRFIRSAQELGFSLDEIRELLTLRSDQGTACPKMQGLLQAKLAAVEGKIASLKSIRTELKSALWKCDMALAGRSCPVLDEIEGRPRRERKA